MVEAEALRPDANHAPEIEEDDGECDDVEHGFGGEAVSLLSPPEGVDSNRLAGDANCFLR